MTTTEDAAFRTPGVGAASQAAQEELSRALRELRQQVSETRRKAAGTPLNAWMARSAAFEEVRLALRKAAAETKNGTGFHQVAPQLLVWVEQCRDHAAAMSRTPITSRTEHAARKAVAAWRAAAKAWRAA